MADFLEPRALIQLIGSGGIARVEEEWMRLVDSADTDPSTMTAYQGVLAELLSRGKRTEASALAWAAVETLLSRHSAQELIPMAGAFLLAVGDGDEFRNQVTNLFRTAYQDRDGLEALLSEAGIAGGRPVRRALRTLEVSLAAGAGQYLVSREGNEAARIGSIETNSWQFAVTTPHGTRTLGAVSLADQWQVAPADDFRVMRRFDPERLRRRLEDDPASVLVELCKRNGNSLDSGDLAAMLAPDLVSEDDWKRWWTKARAALKKSTNLRLEGRSPYTIVFDDRPVDHTAQFFGEFERQRDPLVRLEIVEKYLRDRSDRGEGPDRNALLRCHDLLREQARDAIRTKDSLAALLAACAWQVGEAADVGDSHNELFGLLTETTDAGRLMAIIRRDDLLERVVRAMIEMRPQTGYAELLRILPTLPQSYCDRAVEWLMQGGCTLADLEPVVQRIIGSPIAYFDALLWLWDGPAMDELVRHVPAISLLMRILRALSDARLSDTMGKNRVKLMLQHARSALAARGFERFERALHGVEGGMAAALRNQIHQAESLGRAVEDGLMSRLSPYLPKREPAPVVLPWERDDVVYTTQAGLARKQDELEHHVNVKMRENAIAIGAAAEKGDLSENSEYKFALEERDLLRARLGQMNSELQAARVLPPDDVPTDCVGVGTRVVFRRISDGRPYEITFVGPWESDHEKNRINYKAPLAKTVLGKRVGDSVEFEHTGASGTYEIIELHNGLRELAVEPATR